MAVVVDPDQLGRHYMASGRAAEADNLFVRVLQRDPNQAEVWNNLGIVRQQQKQLVNAFGCYANVLAIDPNSQAAYCNLGFLAQMAGRLNDAVVFYRQALKYAPDAWISWHNLAGVHKELRQFDEALAYIDKAITLAPDNMQAHSSRVYIRDLDPRTTPQQALEVKRVWANKFGLVAQRQWPNNADPDRMLRIGYVSGDFYQHSASFAFANLLFGHDRQKFLVFCYSMTARDDDTTPLFKRGVGWRAIGALSDEQVIEQIRKDKIDILVDLSGFTAGMRLRIFTAKPAPVACHMVGYLDGTGVAEIDHIFLDPVLANVEHYAEEPVSLPCVFNYRPPAAPDVTSPPALNRGYVTFGYCGQWRKVSDDTLALWRQILEAVPGSRLVLKDRRFADQRECDDALRRLDVVAHRVSFFRYTSTFEHLAAHGEFDIGLDPLHANGGVSSLEALWMGLPLVTKPGTRAAGKVGTSLLHALGLGECAADDYVGAAVALAENLPRLRDLRLTMRERIAGTTIGNAALYVAHVERAYRTLWVAYCARSQLQALAS